MKKLISLLSLFIIGTSIVPAQLKNPVDNPEQMAVKFAASEMTRLPHIWVMSSKGPFFGYVEGVLGCSMLKMYDYTGNDLYFNYVKEIADTLVQTDGKIRTYTPEAYNLDLINSGKYLFGLYAKTKDAKYKKAMETLLKQLSMQPRTHDGGFWHKLVYQHQMWLDGIYMATPFMAQYGYTFKKDEWIQQACQQILTVHRHTYDPKTGLYHHAWDESHNERWSDSEGHSPNFWGRSIGWYFMAMVDALDFIPEGFQCKLNLGGKDTIMVSPRDSIIGYVRDLAKALPKYQRNGLWYQVLDCPDREGNYAEGSVTTQFMYALAKAANKGYIDQKYKKIARKTYDSLQKTLLIDYPDGTIGIKQCCAVSGLGGHPRYRDGSYSYYLSEPIIENDGKATGPFIMGCLELAK